MKRMIAAAAALLLALAFFAGCTAAVDIEEIPAREAETPARVLLLAGGENCVGYSYSYHLGDSRTAGRVSEEKYAEYSNGYENVRILYKNMLKPTLLNTYNTSFEPVRLGQGRAASEGYAEGNFGPEVGIAEYFANRFPDETTYIIKFGGGGEYKMAQEWEPRNGRYYEQMAEFFREGLAVLEKDGVDFEISALCFVQGESDARYDSADYGEYLSSFVQAVREEFSDYAPDNGIAFVDAGISKYYINYDEINAAKAEHQERDARNYYVDTVSAGLTNDRDSTDRKHWDALSELRLGGMLAEQVHASLAYRLECETLQEETERAEETRGGYSLSVCADGAYALSDWDFEYGNGLRATAFVRDGYLCAGDGIELIAAPYGRNLRLPDNSLRIVLRADGTRGLYIAAGGAFRAAERDSVHTQITPIAFGENGERGYRAEIFIPSELLPDERMCVAFALTNRNLHEQTRWYEELGTENDRPYSFMPLDGTSLRQSEYVQYGCFWGDGGVLRAKDVWDLEHDDGSEDAYITMTANQSDNDIYMYGSAANVLYAETEVGASAVRNGEMWGKFGLKITSRDNSGLFFYVDAYGDGTDMRGVYLGYVTFTNGEYNGDWTVINYCFDSAEAYQNGNTVNLAIGRDKDVYSLYCEGELVAVLDDPCRIGIAEAYVGLASFNIDLYAHSYYLQAGQ